jgi:antitoxin component of RelBE/YafQ-DinJ toxin-antitoxin module
MAKEIINFRIDEDLKKELTDEADSQSRTLSNMIIIFIKEGLSRKKKPE